MSKKYSISLNSIQSNFHSKEFSFLLDKFNVVNFSQGSAIFVPTSEALNYVINDVAKMSMEEFSCWKCGDTVIRRHVMSPGQTFSFKIEKNMNGEVIGVDGLEVLEHSNVNGIDIYVINGFLSTVADAELLCNCGKMKADKYGWGNKSGGVRGGGGGYDKYSMNMSGYDELCGCDDEKKIEKYAYGGKSNMGSMGNLDGYSSSNYPVVSSSSKNMISATKANRVSGSNSKLSNSSTRKSSKKNEVSWDDDDFTLNQNNEAMADQIYESDASIAKFIQFRSLDYMREHFEVIKRLGAGAFGVTYLSKNLSDGSNVAIKLQRLNEDSDVDLLNAEILALTRSTNDNCGNVMGLFESIYDEQHNQMFFIMELLPGKDMEVFYNRADTRRTIPLALEYWPTEEEFIDKVLNPLLKGLLCLHRNKIAHKDIKLANIMYDPKTETIKLIDLGLSCIEVCRNSLSGSIFAMPVEQTYYQNYEQFVKQEKLDSLPRVDLTDFNTAVLQDIWSLSVALFELLTGTEFDLPTDYRKYEPINLDLLPEDFPHVNNFIMNCFDENYERRLDNWNCLTDDNIGLLADKVVCD